MLPLMDIQYLYEQTSSDLRAVHAHTNARTHTHTAYCINTSVFITDTHTVDSSLSLTPPFINVFSFRNQPIALSPALVIFCQAVTLETFLVARSHALIQSSLFCPSEFSLTSFLSIYVNGFKDSCFFYSAIDFYHKDFQLLIFSLLFFFSQLPHFINSSLPAHDRMTALQIDSYFRQELIYKRNERMARRVSALLQRNPNQTYFFAFGAGKRVSHSLRGMFRVKYRFSFLPSDTLAAGQAMRESSFQPLQRRSFQIHPDWS